MMRKRVKKRKATKKPVEKKGRERTVLAIIVIVLVFIISFYWYNQLSTSEDASIPDTEGGLSIIEIQRYVQGEYEILKESKNIHEKGKVKLFEFLDFMCPHCYNLHQERMIERLKEKYGTSLEVRYVVLHFIEDRDAPFERAARPVEAFEYASDMGKGAEMMDALFQAYHKEEKDITDLAVLESVAKSLGLDTTNFEQRLKSYESRVLVNDRMFYSDYKLPSVPQIIIDGNIIVATLDPSSGYYQNRISFENLTAIIDSLLSLGFIIL
ncbi:MAG: DsbA family protein [Candidatus Methanofastidiosia archaeon]